jgi:DNA-binding GntR family transcriptional regulator
LNDTPPAVSVTQAASNLTAALTGMTGELKTVNSRQRTAERYARRNRALIMSVFGSLALDVILTVLLVLSYGASQTASARADNAAAATAAQHQNLLASCASGNKQRAEQVVVWERVLGATSTSLSAETAADRHLITYIRSVFRPRICAQIYKIP